MAERKTSNEVIMWTAEEIQAKYTGNGSSQLARVLDPSNSDTLSAGLMRMQDAKMEWTMKYDEIIFVTKGNFTIVHEGKRYEGKPGDAILIRRGTPITYESQGEGEGIYAVYPVWWREQQV